MREWRYIAVYLNPEPASWEEQRRHVRYSSSILFKIRYFHECFSEVTGPVGSDSR
jgi:hypothetical protein